MYTVLSTAQQHSIHKSWIVQCCCAVDNTVFLKHVNSVCDSMKESMIDSLSHRLLIIISLSIESIPSSSSSPLSYHTMI